MGVDILWYNPTEDVFPNELDPDGKLSQITEYPRRLQIKPFPAERTIAKVSTEAQKASDQLRDILHTDDSFLYRPWQFIDYELDTKVLHSTYEEIAIYACEEAKMRDGWHAGQERVTLSNFFALIKGVHADQKKFFKELNALIELDMTIFVNQLPVLKEVTTIRKKEYYEVLAADHTVDIDKLRNASFWPYKNFPDHVQKRLAVKIARICQLKGVKRETSVPIEIQKIKTFTTLLAIPENYLRLLQQFDYPGQVPKIVVYNNETNGDMTQEDALLFYLMALTGIDLFIFNPAAHNDIEQFIEDECFNRHYLEKIGFNLKYKPDSLLKRLFS
jgi:hypothetical protein